MPYKFDAKKTTENLIQWIRNHINLHHPPNTKVIIGISGGKDSSIAAAACVKALGKDRVFGVLMPQGYQHDIGVSWNLCRELGIDYTEINIEPIVNSVYEAMEKTTNALPSIPLNKTITSNTPARIRMTLLYAVSASVGGRVCNTSNLSEDWVGYATKFGDAAGDFTLFSHLTCTEVKQIGRELGLPDFYIDKTPEDGLQPLTDEENFGFTYEMLDELIRTGDSSLKGDEKQAFMEKVHKMNKGSRHKFRPMEDFRNFTIH